MKKNYSNLSIKLTNDIDNKTKKNEGIYFTSKKLAEKNLDLLSDIIDLNNIETILEPSCGSCEFINLLNERLNNNENLSIIGIENNETIFESVKYLNEETDNIKIYNDDYLKWDNENRKFDLIIGNPPFYVLTKKNVDKKYYKYFEGRPNIFILFIIESLNKLNVNGVLSFILPKNFLNCLYYDKTREYINNNFTILNIVDCNHKFLETGQETIIIIIKNEKDETNNNEKFILTSINNYTIFNFEENVVSLNNLLQNVEYKTLSELNFNVNIGSVVWNQCKDILSDNEEDTLLIYSSNIDNGELKIKNYKDKQKKNYIKKKGLNKPNLLVNRGYGVGQYNFNYCLITPDNELIKNGYLIENHVISITYKGEIDNDELIEKYENIIESLKNNRTKEFIKLYFGNNAINTTELNAIIPIYD